MPGAAVSGIAADFEDAGQVQHLLASLGGDLDILVNNVGLFELKPFADIADDEWQRYFDVNVMSGVRLSRHVLDTMLARNWGRILFIGTESGRERAGRHGALRADQGRRGRAGQWPRQADPRYRRHRQHDPRRPHVSPMASLDRQPDRPGAGQWPADD